MIGKTKLTDEDRHAIKTLKGCVPYSVIVQKYGISKSTIYSIQNEEKSKSRREETPAPSWGFYYTTSTKKMKVKTLRTLLVALVILNILDGDFANPSILDWIKFVLLAVCLILSFRKEKS